MTLIVSMRTVDGIVLAGDSLATYISYPQVQGDIDIHCPQCGHDHTTQATLWGNALPARTLSYAQKVFPFYGNYGVGTFGAGQLNKKTVYFLMRALEHQILEGDVDVPATASEAADLIGNRMLETLRDEMVANGRDLDSFPDDWTWVGAQVVGYEIDQPITYEVRIGKTVHVTEHVGLDVTPSGMDEVFQALYQIYSANHDSVPLVEQFSLQDAIDYAEFLIKTTALHQQFSRRIPSVGGDIDIAVITPFDGFKWVRQKTLYRKLTPGDV